MRHITFHTAPTDCFNHGVQLIGEIATDSISVDSADMCHLVCLAKAPNCNFFSFNTDESTCSLLSLVTEQQTNPAYVSGLKVCTTEATTLPPAPLTTVLCKLLLKVLFTPCINSTSCAYFQVLTLSPALTCSNFLMQPQLTAMTMVSSSLESKQQIPCQLTLLTSVT